jgi:hypothetical protein
MAKSDRWRGGSGQMVKWSNCQMVKSERRHRGRGGARGGGRRGHKVFFPGHISCCRERSSCFRGRKSYFWGRKSYSSGGKSYFGGRGGMFGGRGRSFCASKNYFCARENSFRASKNYFRASKNSFCARENFLRASKNSFCASKNSFRASENSFCWHKDCVRSRKTCRRPREYSAHANKTTPHDIKNRPGPRNAARRAGQPQTHGGGRGIREGPGGDRGRTSGQGPLFCGQGPLSLDGQVLARSRLLDHRCLSGRVGEVRGHQLRWRSLLHIRCFPIEPVYALARKPGISIRRPTHQQSRDSRRSQPCHRD